MAHDFKLLKVFAQPGHGEMGHAVVIPSEKTAEADSLFKINQFNLMASDLMSVNRSLPDYRSYRFVCSYLLALVYRLSETTRIFDFSN